AHHFEEIVADECAADAGRLASSGDEGSPVIERGDAVEERRLRAEIDDVRVRNLAATIILRTIVPPEQNDAVSAIERQRFDQHRIDDTEDRSIRADSE